MKEAILISKGDYSYKNIGDYIQSIACKGFLKNAQLNIDREKIDLFKSEEPVKCILNGWFMEHPEHWPPSKNIIPLLISMHINKTKADVFFADGGAEYLRLFGPVGCRDKSTVELLRAKGIQAYYSSCLTLTLSEQYRREKSENQKVIFVDPYCNPCRNKRGKFSLMHTTISAIMFVTNFKVTKKIFKKYNFENADTKTILVILKAITRIGRFVEVYKKVFSEEILSNAMFICHNVSKKRNPTVEDMYKVADSYLKEYASAGLVVTSRLHCALPCLGIGTPVIFIKSILNTTDNEKIAPLSTGRFDGIFDFLNCIRYENNKLVEDSGYKLNLINYKKIPLLKNKTRHLECKKLLIAKCTEFAKNNSFVQI